MHVQISVDKEMVSFGSVCVGEVCKRTVTITNSGALPTTYHLLPAPLSPLRVSHHTVNMLKSRQGAEFSLSLHGIFSIQVEKNLCHISFAHFYFLMK